MWWNFVEALVFFRKHLSLVIFPVPWWQLLTVLKSQMVFQASDPSFGLVLTLISEWFKFSLDCPLKLFSMFWFLEKMRRGKDWASPIPSSVSLNKALAPVAMFWEIIALGDQIKGEKISWLRMKMGSLYFVSNQNNPFLFFPQQDLAGTRLLTAFYCILWSDQSCQYLFLSTLLFSVFMLILEQTFLVPCMVNVFFPWYIKHGNNFFIIIEKLKCKFLLNIRLKNAASLPETHFSEVRGKASGSCGSSEQLCVALYLRGWQKQEPGKLQEEKQSQSEMNIWNSKHLKITPLILHQIFCCLKIIFISYLLCIQAQHFLQWGPAEEDLNMQENDLLMSSQNTGTEMALSPSSAPCPGKKVIETQWVLKLAQLPFNNSLEKCALKYFLCKSELSTLSFWFQTWSKSEKCPCAAVVGAQSSSVLGTQQQRDLSILIVISSSEYRTNSPRGGTSISVQKIGTSNICYPFIKPEFRQLTSLLMLGFVRTTADTFWRDFLLLWWKLHLG